MDLTEATEVKDDPPPLATAVENNHALLARTKDSVQYDREEKDIGDYTKEASNRTTPTTLTRNLDRELDEIQNGWDLRRSQRANFPSHYHGYYRMPYDLSTIPTGLTGKKKCTTSMSPATPTLLPHTSFIS